VIPIPKIALVGRPNVGKSTLFNRICGRRKAITDSRPGSTRDRNYAHTSWQGAAFELVDTGGLLAGTKNDPLLGPAGDQARRAIAEADLVILVVDGRAGLLPDDAAIAQEVRRAAKRVVVAMNKVETANGSALDEFARLGFDEKLAISAEHGIGVGDLLDAALAGVPKVAVPEEDRSALRVAFLGRPNVGKSSLLNAFLGEERAVVSAIPGTTRDAVDSLIERGGRRFLFVDTAGMRRSRHLKENVDHVSVVQARRSLDRADVAVLVLDTEEGLREMDAKVAGEAAEAGRGIVVAVNKWDLARARSLTQRGFTQEVRDHLKFLAWAPVRFVSAKTGKGLDELLAEVERVQVARNTRVTTGELNRMLAGAARRYAPKPEKGSGDVKILFATQIGVAPPTFVISLNRPTNLHFSYRRYLENQLRESFGFEGTPIVLKVRSRRH